jgi:hypothetical protein
LISLPLIRPELFRKGILKKNFIPGVLLFGPPGTGKVFPELYFFFFGKSLNLFTHFIIDHVG